MVAEEPKKESLVPPGQQRRNKLLLKDYTKFKGFRPCGMRLESEKTKEEVLAAMCNMCPRRHLPPCRDKDHPSFRGDPDARTFRYFRPCREPDFKWPDFPPKW